MDSSGPPVTPSSFGIGAKMAALVCVLVAVVTAAGGIWSDLHLSGQLLREEFSRQRAAASSAGAQLIGGIESLRRDVTFLSAAPAVEGIIRARQGGGIDPVDRLTENQWRQRLADLFEARLLTTPSYFQIRLVGAADNSREIVRVDRRDNDVLVAPNEDLEETGDREYLREALRAPAGAIYLFRIELHEEHGSVTEPHIPTLRAATVIPDSSGKPFGLLIINTDLRSRFQEITAALADRYKLYIFDENLDFILHPDPSRAFGFQFGRPIRVTHEFPDLRNTLLADGKTQALVNDAASGEKVLASLSRVQPDPVVSSRSYGLLATADYAATIAHSTEQRTQTILFGCLLMIITLSTVLVASRRLTRPLHDITSAVQDFAQGKTNVKLPVGASDEAGVLARAFDQMIRQVRQHRDDLEAEVAERRRTEEALRESDHRLRLALGAAQAGVWEWDILTNRTMWDKSIEAMAPFDPKTFSGTIDSWIELMHPQDRRNLAEAKRRTMEENRPFEVEFRIRARDGGWRHWSARGDLIRADYGYPMRLVGICFDVTEAKQRALELEQLNRKLQEQNRDLDEFNHMVSHDLREPIRHLMVFGQRLRDYHSQALPERANRDLRQIQEAAERMENSIGGLQLLSQTSRWEMNRTRVALESCVRAALVDLERITTPKGVTVSCEPLPLVVGDPALLTLLFRQLISNAVRYCHETPSIHITVEKVAGQLVFGVRDNGIGVEPRYAERIFKAFQRLHGRHEYGGGTGLGLAICRKVIARHGGGIWVEPNVPSGAHFRFTLTPDATIEPQTEAADCPAVPA